MMRVLVVERSRSERRAMVDALVNIDRVAVIGAVPDEDRALEVIAQMRPEIIVAGISDDAPAIELIERASASTPAPKIVVVGDSPTREQWRRYLAAGADRFVERDGELAELQGVIETLVQACAEDEDVLRLLGRLAVGVAHDLNGYLGATRALLALASQGAAAERELLHEAQDSLEPALRLTASLVEYVRGNSPPCESLELGALVRRVAAIAARASRASVKLAVDAPALAPVRGAISELEQLVLNLALNACDASPDGATVQIRLRGGDGGVTLEVIDQGAGFVGAHVVGGALGTTTKTGRRAGLGLGIVHRVVRQHGGTFRVHSTEHGTVASVFLPA